MVPSGGSGSSMEISHSRVNTSMPVLCRVEVVAVVQGPGAGTPRPRLTIVRPSRIRTVPQHRNRTRRSFRLRARTLIFVPG